MTELSDASRAQIDAADPKASTWLSANAGSGKTRVLTDRVARLLLHGVPPQRILCLTYTKAAATEMQNRLFRRLGAWAMLNDKALTESLAELGVTGDLNLNRARTLFARAIETPGGLKIQTIHSFCASLLRQFPLESGVSPQFREMDEEARERLIDGILDLVSAKHPAVLERLGRHYAGQSLTDLAKEVVGAGNQFDVSERDVLACFDLTELLEDDALLDLVVSTDDLDFLSGLPGILRTSTKKTDHTLADKLASLADADPATQLQTLAGAFLTGTTAKSPFTAKIGSVPTADLRKGPFEPYTARLEAIMRSVEDAREAVIRRDVAEKTLSLHAFANIFLPAYAETKAEQGLLDFDDLIIRARDLLTNVEMAWILFRLDGGIDHILVDEAQDTSPAQWAVIQALSEEMAAGQGVREVARTLFVVGDKKQSIYSFQGADARGFEAMRGNLLTAPGGEPGLRERALTYSFRSAPVILQTVDRVFEGENALGLGNDVVHRAFHDELAGRVDLWDLEEASKVEDDPPWYAPVDRTSEHSPRVRLARKIATHVAGMLESGTIAGENGANRRVQAGDILILVRSRNELFDAIIRACKTANLPIAGADQLRVNAELAVRDILALLSFLALPDDELSLAVALRSPLFGWSERDLYGLAQPRADGKGLWQALREREAEFPKTVAKLYELRRRADFLRPYELIELILTRMNGRKDLVARLGVEAEDGIDELLNQALTYEQTEVPSLTGFVARTQANEVKVKRRVDSSSNLIRVMTIHGAKGLEAPIVILPDTIHEPPKVRGSFLAPKDGVPVWNVASNVAPEPIQVAKDAAIEAAIEEDNRLLYVAMTRAAKWLIVAGAEPKKEKATSWWASVRTAMERDGAVRHSSDDVSFLRLENGLWPNAPVDAAPEVTKAAKPTDLEHLVEDAPPLTEAVGRISPSDLGGAKVLPGDPGEGDTAAAKAYGTAVHQLLEVLPATPRETWTLMGRALLDGIANIDSVIEEAIGVIDTFPDVFSENAMSEVELTATAGKGKTIVFGAVDRLVLDPDRVRIIDFKTNSAVPDSPDRVPEGILRQMGAYLVAAEQIWLEHQIELEIIWTRTLTKMVLPHAIVRKAFERTPIS